MEHWMVVMKLGLYGYVSLKKKQMEDEKMNVGCDANLKIDEQKKNKNTKLNLWHSLLSPLGHIHWQHPVQSTTLDPHWLSRGHLTRTRSCLIGRWPRTGRCC